MSFPAAGRSTPANPTGGGAGGCNGIIVVLSAWPPLHACLDTHSSIPTPEPYVLLRGRRRGCAAAWAAWGPAACRWVCRGRGCGLGAVATSHALHARVQWHNSLLGWNKVQFLDTGEAQLRQELAAQKQKAAALEIEVADLKDRAAAAEDRAAAADNRRWSGRSGGVCERSWPSCAASMTT